VLDIASATSPPCKNESAGHQGLQHRLGDSYSVRQVCDAVEKVSGHRPSNPRGGGADGDPAMLCASPKRVIQEWAWSPKHSSLEEIITSAWRWKRTLRRHASACMS